jgi:uncharacterized phage protein gp47/JayE
MAVEADLIYRSRDQVRAALLAALQARIPDAWVEEDGILYILMEIVAGEIEGVYLANQILRDNIFPQTASQVELERHGETFGLPILPGTTASGTVLLSGQGGKLIPTGAEIGHDPGTGDDILVFVTSADATIPNPGIPAAPTVADGGAGGVLPAGSYEYAVTFVTDAGETVLGTPSSVLLITANQQIQLTNIPLGGPGTTQRKIYRQKDGGGFLYVATLANNTGQTFTDTTATTGGSPPAESTAEAISVAAESAEAGAEYNLATGAVTTLVDVPDGIVDVTNTTAFTGGSDPEDSESYRARLLTYIRNPKSGSISDLASWAKEVTGVEEASAFPNYNGTTPANGHVTIRITGPSGSIPDADVIQEVQDYLDAKDIANITIHVLTFTPVTLNVTVTVTPQTDFSVSDVTASVEDAISAYIEGVPVGETVYIAGIIDAVFGLPGVANVSVTAPASDTTATATEKIVPGSITVS